MQWPDSQKWVDWLEKTYDGLTAEEILSKGIQLPQDKKYLEAVVNDGKKASREWTTTLFSMVEKRVLLLHRVKGWPGEVGDYISYVYLRVWNELLSFYHEERRSKKSSQVRVTHGWLNLRIVSRAIDMYRQEVQEAKRRVREVSLSERDLPEVVQVKADRAIEPVDVIAMVKQLPDRQRIAFVLSVLKKLSNEEIGAMINCSGQAVANLKHRAIKRLRQLAGETMEQPAPSTPARARAAGQSKEDQHD